MSGEVFQDLSESTPLLRGQQAGGRDDRSSQQFNLNVRYNLVNFYL